MPKIEKETPSRVVIVPRPSSSGSTDSTSTTNKTKSLLEAAVKKAAEGVSDESVREQLEAEKKTATPENNKEVTVKK
jgi:hypothetical protein